MDLIFDQKYVAVWREKIISSGSRQAFDQFLSKICPAIQLYLQILQDINQQSAVGRSPLPQKNQFEQAIIEVEVVGT